VGGFFKIKTAGSEELFSNDGLKKCPNIGLFLYWRQKTENTICINLYILQWYLGTNLCIMYIKITAKDFASIVKLVKSFVITVICHRKGSL
jgi:hypothetical protein